jgi:hypothetical protein
VTVVGVDGMPMYGQVMFFPFDGAGEWSYPETADSALAGHTFDVQVIGIDGVSGGAMLTNIETIDYQ